MKNKVKFFLFVIIIIHIVSGLFFSLSMLFNSGKSNIPSTLDFGVWAFIFVGISLILHLKSRYVQ